MPEKERNDKMRARRPKRKACAFCVDKVEFIDYKSAKSLALYIASTGLSFS